MARGYKLKGRMMKKHNSMFYYLMVLVWVFSMCSDLKTCLARTYRLSPCSLSANIMMSVNSVSNGKHVGAEIAPRSQPPDRHATLRSSRVKDKQGLRFK